MYNIIWKVINMQTQKCRSKNGAWTNYSIKQKIYLKICSWQRLLETILENRKKTILQEAIDKLINHKLLKYFTNNRKKTNRAVIFSCRPLPHILQYKDHRWDHPTIWKTRFIQTNNEFSWYAWKFNLKVLQNHHWNPIRPRHFLQIKVRYERFNQLGNYWNIMQFQISPRKISR